MNLKVKNYQVSSLIKIRKQIGIILIVSVTLILTICTNSTQTGVRRSAIPTEKAHEHSTPISATDSLKYVTHAIEVKGDVEKELTLTVDSLRKMKTYTLDEFNVVCIFEGIDTAVAKRKQDKTRKGVLLKDILDKARINQHNHKDRNFYIVARAADDYMATFSWAELFNNVTGEHTFVLFEENGKPIEKRGAMILVCANDIKTGPRHVIWLKSIVVERVK